MNTGISKKQWKLVKFKKFSLISKLLRWIYNDFFFQFHSFNLPLVYYNNLTFAAYSLRLFVLPFANDIKTFTWIYHFVIVRCCDIELIFSAYFTTTTILPIYFINVFTVVHNTSLSSQPVHFETLQLSKTSMYLVSIFVHNIACALKRISARIFSYRCHSFIVFSIPKNNKSTSPIHYYQNVINLIVYSVKSQEYCTVSHSLFFHCYNTTSFSVILMKAPLLLKTHQNENNKLS